MPKNTLRSLYVSNFQSGPGEPPGIRGRLNGSLRLNSLVQMQPYLVVYIAVWSSISIAVVIQCLLRVRRVLSKKQCAIEDRENP